MKTIRRYSELVTLDSFEERFNYLKLDNQVGMDTFGFDRYMNQQFYHSKEWKDIRDYVITRDNGCDLGIPGREIYGRIYIHHMNPLTKSDVEMSTENLLNPDYLICTSHETHNAIHYGDDSILHKNIIIERTPMDTCPWKKL